MSLILRNLNSLFFKFKQQYFCKTFIKRQKHNLSWYNKICCLMSIRIKLTSNNKKGRTPKEIKSKKR